MGERRIKNPQKSQLGEDSFLSDKEKEGRRRGWTWDILFSYLSSVGDWHQVWESAESIQNIRIEEKVFCHQDHREFAWLLWLLLGLDKEYDVLLEIGSAAGGTARLLKDILGAKRLYIIDDNGDVLCKFRKFFVPEAIEWIGDSHSEDCRKQLERWGERFDLVHVDGDHTYSGVTKDVDLIKPWLREGSVVVFHDIVGWEGVRTFWKEVLEGKFPFFVPIGEIKLWAGIGVVRFKEGQR